MFIMDTLKISLFFFFNDTATTEIYTLSLHDALPICPEVAAALRDLLRGVVERGTGTEARSEEHTSELQSRLHLVCRLLLEKKKIPEALCLALRFLSASQWRRGVAFTVTIVGRCLSRI